MKALLIGKPPCRDLGYEYVQSGDYDGVVIGSLSLNELLHFSSEPALQALAEGKSVVLYTPGLPVCSQNRALSASLTSAQRQLKSWGVVFTDGAQKRLITAQEARQLLQQGNQPAPGAVLTPLAKEILEKQ